MKWVTDWILDPKKFAKLNVYGAWFWIGMVPVSVLTGWLSLVEYVSALSIYALAGFHLSTYAAARTEILQAEADAKNQETLDKVRETLDKVREVLDKLVKMDPDDPRG